MNLTDSTAIHDVFDISELLEHILSYLEIPQLLTVSRVCTRWRAITFESPHLQRKLMMAPLLPTTGIDKWFYFTNWNNQHASTSGRDNHIYLDMQDPRVSAQADCMKVYPAVKVNPCFEERDVRGPSPGRIHLKFSCGSDVYNEKASFRRMLFSQPPPTFVALRLCFCSRRRSPRRHSWICNERSYAVGKWTVGEMMEKEEKRWGPANIINWERSHITLCRAVVDDNRTRATVEGATKDFAGLLSRPSTAQK